MLNLESSSDIFRKCHTSEEINIDLKKKKSVLKVLGRFL